MESSSSSSSSGSITKAIGGVRMENPFTFKVGQVFTGFGIGCGVGIGVGRPLNLGAIPMLGQVMSAASGATHALSGVGRHVNGSLKKIGAKNIEAGIGCGVGFGHGFGVGLALKPGVVHQLQLFVVESAGKMMTKFGVSQNLSIGQDIIPTSMQNGTSMTNQAFAPNPTGNMMQLGGAANNPIQDLLGDNNLIKGLSYENIQSKGVAANSPVSNSTDNVISSFLQNPVLRDNTQLNEIDEGQLQQENRMLRMVLKHEQVIEELMGESEKLRQILVEELKVSPDKLHSSYSSKCTSRCSECFECRRKQRRR